jgi:hypothetical protein
LAGSLYILITGYHSLQRSDWLVAFFLGALVGAGMYFATLHSPYPFLGLINDNRGHALSRWLYTTLAMLGGLVIMRRGGPVQILSAKGEWRKLASSLVVGLATGAPLAVLNVFALQLTQGRPVDWQNPWAALLDALQPAMIEEVVYRFAFLGLLWLALSKPLPDQAPWAAGLLSMLVHNFMHFDELFIQAPWVALGMGTLMTLIWGLPLTYLALRRGLESAIAFHWIQDVARFVAGY